MINRLEIVSNMWEIYAVPRQGAPYKYADIPALNLHHIDSRVRLVFDEIKTSYAYRNYDRHGMYQY